MGIKNILLNEASLLKVVVKAPKMHRLMDQTCDEIIKEAKDEFSRRDVGGNEQATSELSPPRYLQSFGKERDGDCWKVYNKDPGAMLVEFGAHAAGKTEVLGYSPIRKAIDRVSD